MSPALLSFPPQAEPSSLASVISAGKWAYSPLRSLGSELQGPWQPSDAPNKALKEAKAATARTLGGELPSFSSAPGLDGKSKLSPGTGLGSSS